MPVDELLGLALADAPILEPEQDRILNLTIVRYLAGVPGLQTQDLDREQLGLLVQAGLVNYFCHKSIN